MRPSFLKLERPFVAAIVAKHTAAETILDMRIAEHGGAQAFAVDFSTLEAASREPDELKRIIHSTGRPVMPLTYRSNHFAANLVTDEERAAIQLKAAELGAAGCDLMGDLFHASPRELTRDADAIARQRRLIDQLHERGAEVLMSSHMSEALSADEILEHMLEVQSRGVDIAKIVTVANTEEELLESFRATVLLKRTLRVPFVQLCNGRYALLQRYVAPSLGAMLTFCVNQSAGSQPFTEAARRTLDELLWHREFPEG